MRTLPGFDKACAAAESRLASVVFGVWVLRRNFQLQHKLCVAPMKALLSASIVGYAFDILEPPNCKKNKTTVAARSSTETFSASNSASYTQPA